MQRSVNIVEGEAHGAATIRPGAEHLAALLRAHAARCEPTIRLLLGRIEEYEAAYERARFYSNRLWLASQCATQASIWSRIESREQIADACRAAREARGKILAVAWQQRDIERRALLPLLAARYPIMETTL